MERTSTQVSGLAGSKSLHARMEATPSSNEPIAAICTRIRQALQR